MQFLFDSHGRHIANFGNGRLYSPTGANIGCFLEKHGIFTDLQGRYLGEIVRENRLMSNRNSIHRSVNYGAHGNSGSVGNPGNPGTNRAIGSVPGFEDIEPARFGQSR